MNDRIKRLSREEVLELRKRIRPVLRFAIGEEGLFVHQLGFLYDIVIKGDPVSQSFLYDYKVGHECTNLELLKEITTVHHTGGMLVMPTEGEVLAQIPENILDQVVAYEVFQATIIPQEEGSIAVARTKLYKNR